MIRVLIAEDEPPIARAISRMICELSPDFKVTACVSNGHDALEQMLKDPADLVITDIRMPMMDGLELLKALRTDWPDCVIVILSGYQDFSYTQSALRLGAFDYLLKPVSREKLRELLDRFEELHARNLLQEAVVSWRCGGIGGSSGGIGGGGGGSSNGGGGSSGGGGGPAADAISFSKDVAYALILAIAGHWPSVIDDTLSPGAVFWQSNDPEYLLRDLLGWAPGAKTFVGRSAAERIFLLENKSADEAAALAGELFGRLTQLSPLPKTLCLVPGPLGFGDVAPAIRTARKQVYTRIGLCRSALLFSSDPDITEPPRSLSPEALTEALCVRSEEQIATSIIKAVNRAVSSGMTQMSFEHFLDTAIHDRRLSLDTVVVKAELSEAIIDASTPDNLKADLAHILTRHVLGESKAETESRIEQIRLYLCAHFTEDISSETLSARFGFVPSYLSRLFRRQTGKSPTEFLTGLRVEKAKELLDTRPGMLIRDAALLVGYKDPYYFSKLFKKATGLWPSQYQERAKPEND